MAEWISRIVGVAVSLSLVSASPASAATLTHVATYTDGIGGISGLPNPTEVLVSPDGAHVYVRNATDVLSVFERDGVTGALTSAASYALGVDLPEPVGGWATWIITPDGLSVLIGGDSIGNGELMVLERNASTGALTFVESHVSAGAVLSLAASADSEYVYVGSRDGLFVFDRSTGTGELTPSQQYSATKFFPNRILATADHLYTVTPGFHTIRVFARDSSTGEVSILQKLSPDYEPHCPVGTFNCDVEGRNLGALVPDAGGTFLYGTGRHHGTFEGALLDTWRVDQGKLEAVDRQFLKQCYAADPEPGLHLHPDGLRMFGSDAVYALDPTSGAISLLEDLTATIASAGITAPRLPAVSPDGLHFYMPGLNDDSIALFSIGASPTTGPTRDCRYWGQSLVVRNAGPGGLITSINWKAVGTIGLPVEDSPNDPRCNGDPAGTVKATLRFASATSGEDTGDLPLPCENWRTFGKPTSLTRGYRYDDKQKTSGPCKKVVLKGKKIVSAVCDNKGPSPLSYTLTGGLSEGEIDAVLQVGDIRYCTRYDAHNGADGSDGKKFQGKKDGKPSACPTF